MKTAIFATILTSIFFYSLWIGLDKQAMHECLVWQKQAKEFPGYYLLKWQKEQCDYFGIEINAPVKHSPRN